MASKSRLGKGLGALFPTLPGEPIAEAENKELVSSFSEDAAGKKATESTTSVAQTVSTSSDITKTSTSTARTSKGNNATGDTLSAHNSTDDVESSVAESGKQAHKDAGENASYTSSKDTKNRSHRSGSNVSRETRGRSSRRAAMPALNEIAHPSDLFFGETVSETPNVPAMSSTKSAARGDSQSIDTVSRETSETNSEANDLKPVNGGYLAELHVDQIVPNSHQPRTIFDEDDLRELAESIKEVGVLQPIVVRKLEHTTSNTQQQIPERLSSRATSQDSAAAVNTKDDEDNKKVTSNARSLSATYELVMGERRWRATQQAGLETIPAIVKTTPEDNMLRDALLENLHRVALNPLEEAAAYQQMIDDFGLTQAELSKSVSKSRPQIANTLRLLNLPGSVQKKVASGVLSAGHARALLGLPREEEMNKLANRIIAEGLSVRSTEEIVAMQTNEAEQQTKTRIKRTNPWVGSPIQTNLENHFDTKVSIKGTKKHGRIEIVFSSPEDMDRILGLLMPESTANTSEWV